MNSSENKTFFTIGHSNVALQEFIETLKFHQINYLADIRRYPLSSKFLHFNKENLEKVLPANGISYLHIPQLGGKRGGFQGYKNYINSPSFLQGISILTKLLIYGKVAYMCAEKLPWKCHRWLLSEYLLNHNFKIFHIIREKIYEHSLVMSKQMPH